MTNFIGKLVVVTTLLGLTAIKPVYPNETTRNLPYQNEPATYLYSQNLPPTSRDNPKDDITLIIEMVFGGKTEEAQKIANCESGLNPERINYEDEKFTGHKSYGLFQINGYFENWSDPYVNSLKAKEIYDKYSWIRWKNCYQKMVK